MSRFGAASYPRYQRKHVGTIAKQLFGDCPVVLRCRRRPRGLKRAPETNVPKGREEGEEGSVGFFPGAVAKA